MRTTILAEYRRGGFAATLEKVETGVSKSYRIMTADRFQSIDKATESFLALVPAGAQARYKAKIAEQLEQGADASL